MVCHIAVPLINIPQAVKHSIVYHTIRRVALYRLYLAWIHLKRQEFRWFCLVPNEFGFTDTVIGNCIEYMGYARFLHSLESTPRMPGLFKKNKGPALVDKPSTAFCWTQGFRVAQVPCYRQQEPMTVDDQDMREAKASASHYDDVIMSAMASQITSIYRRRAKET